MPEYTYLLEKRLTEPQKNALNQIRDAAREAGMTVFLAGGAVRDLTTGSSVRDLDFTVQGNALELEQAIVARGGVLWGKVVPTRTLYVWFPGSVRVEVSSARSERYPKPGKPEYTWSAIIDDLFRRDFTANAMALSLNEGSYGLLLDPLNGVADIEARQLRLVSNYGYIEDPSRLIRTVRLLHRLGWTLEERTAVRFENARESDNFADIDPKLRGYEIEKIAAEEEALGVLKALEAGGWLEKLFPGWTSAAVDTAALENLHRNRIQLLMQGVVADLTAVHLEVLTAKMKAPLREQLKGMLVRPGLVKQWESLEANAKEFGRKLTGKEAAVASAAWNLFHSSEGEPILWLAHTRKGAALEAKFKDLLSVWPELAKKVPVAVMLEMRITPELPGYDELLHAMFLKQIDGLLETDELMRAFLEPYSPPAPPPPVTLRRTRSKKQAKGRKEAARDDDDEDEDDARPRSSDDDEDEDEDRDRGHHDDDDEDHDEPPPVKKPAAEPARKEKAVDPKLDSRPEGKPEQKAAPAAKETVAPKSVPVKSVPVKSASVKTASVKTASVKTAETKPDAKGDAAKVAPAKATDAPVAPAKKAAKVPVKAVPAPSKAAAVKAPAGKAGASAKAAAPAKKAAAAPVAKPSSVRKHPAPPVKAAPAKKTAAAKPPAKKAAPAKAVARKATAPKPAAKKAPVKKAPVVTKKIVAKPAKKAAKKSGRR